MRQFGVGAVLVEVGSLEDVLALHPVLAALRGVEEVVPGARTLLVRYDETARLDDIAAARPDPASTDSPHDRGETVEVPVVYDGPDLEEVAAHNGLTCEEVVARHLEATYTATFSGFAPGFAYLAGGTLRVPRRESPRTRVHQGAVGLADEFSGIYPRPGPGGWQLIGTTDAALWDLDRDPPAMLTPGTRVRFVQVDSLSTASPRELARSDGPVEVLATGPLTTVQDLGRPGYSHLGVGRSGAADQGALRLANRLLGNDEGAACLEATFGGLALGFSSPTTVAVTGAPCPVEIDGRGAWTSGPVRVRSRLRLGTPEHGLRSYVAVRGGIEVAPVLGSRSSDILAGVGPSILSTGDRLPVGRAGGPWPGVDLAPVAALPEEPVLSVLPGPRADWFEEGALEALTGAAYTVGSDSNRVGLRLTGPALRHLDDRELPSEAMVRGALQVPPDGQPVLFLADHPVTGGYPVIGVVVETDIAAQLRPGQRVRFRT